MIHRLREKGIVLEVSGDTLDDLAFDPRRVDALALGACAVSAVVRVAVPLHPGGREQQTGEHEGLGLGGAHRLAQPRLVQGENFLGLLLGNKRRMRLAVYLPFFAGAPDHCLPVVLFRSVDLPALIPDCVAGVGEGVALDGDQTRHGLATKPSARGCFGAPDALGAGAEKHADLLCRLGVEHKRGLLHGLTAT
ncbi:MAG: hypothetical protein HZB40_16650 [Rhodocyclales bacterium]|nr:hypothetical protein [Rhodocyclales bacterium]